MRLVYSNIFAGYPYAFIDIIHGYGAQVVATGEKAKTVAWFH
jgi:hypothetical protein